MDDFDAVQAPTGEKWRWIMTSTGDARVVERQPEAPDTTVVSAPGETAVVPSSMDSALPEAPSGGDSMIILNTPARAGVSPVGPCITGVLTLVFGVWAGIVSFVGPTFGFSADGASSWYWDLEHSLLWLLPDAVATAVGLLMLGLVPRALAGARFGSALTGLILVLCGGWLVLGPLAWPVMESSAGVFVPASPIRELAYQASYSSGPGLLLAILGAFAMGWAVRSRRSV